jgi:hypothetical protein
MGCSSVLDVMQHISKSASLQEKCITSKIGINNACRRRKKSGLAWRENRRWNAKKKGRIQATQDATA